VREKTNNSTMTELKTAKEWLADDVMIVDERRIRQIQANALRWAAEKAYDHLGSIGLFKEIAGMAEQLETNDPA
jgi:hypothetical protein